jgi:predicted DCC family thiol-disulfide oxidoreductase YuxK
MCVVCSGEVHWEVQGDEANRWHLNTGHHHEDIEGLHYAEFDPGLLLKRTWCELCQGNCGFHLTKDNGKRQALNHVFLL